MYRQGIKYLPACNLSLIFAESMLIEYNLAEIWSTEIGILPHINIHVEEIPVLGAWRNKALCGRRCGRITQAECAESTDRVIWKHFSRDTVS